MTQPCLADRVLEHLVWVYSIDTEYAKSAALNYEEICPHECHGMYERLRRRIVDEKRRKRWTGLTDQITGQSVTTSD